MQNLDNLSTHKYKISQTQTWLEFSDKKLSTLDLM